MAVGTVGKLAALCVVLTALSAGGHCSGDVDYRKAQDILANNLEQSDASNVKGQFVSFMQDHERVYPSQTEMFQRLAYFNKSLDRVRERQKAEKGTAIYGVTRFSDYSDEEFQRLGGLRIPSYALTTAATELTAAVEVGGLPKSFDWRSRNVVTSVKDQGLCGSCWAFCSLACVESQHAIKTKKLVDLSEQQLLDCDKEDQGCTVGLMETAFDYIKKAGGVQLESLYPYAGHHMPHKSQHCNISQVKEQNLVQVLSRKIIDGGEPAMRKELVEHGPFTVALNYINLHGYIKGVIDVSDEQCNPNDLNHGVLIVGYGQETEATGETKPFWIAKNSWRSSWGEDGYFRMRRGKNVCGIEFYACSAETN